MKKIISMYLIISVIVLNVYSVALASSNSDVALESVNEITTLGVSEQQKIEISNALLEIEAYKEKLGMGNVEFNEIMIGSGIPTYNYTENGFGYEKDYYPIVYNGKIIALAIYRANSEGTLKYQITTALVEEINQNISAKKEIALIYDLYNVYLYNGDTFALLYENSQPTTNREVLYIDDEFLDTSDIIVGNIDSFESINYNDKKVQSETSTLSATDTEVILDELEYVTQLNDINGNRLDVSYMCWAATIASIANVCLGTDYNAVDIAQEVPRNEAELWDGVNEYNHALLNSRVVGVLEDFGVSGYTWYNKAPSESRMYRNIVSGYPVFGRFSYDAGGHAVSIFGVNTNQDYIWLMDPEFGSTLSFREDGLYKYISAFSGVELTLTQAATQYK